MRARLMLLLSALVMCLVSPVWAETRLLDRASVVAPYDGRVSDFLAVDIGAGTRCVLSGSDLTRRHAPWSSFKIPNFVIALETGVATGPDHWRAWDPSLRPAAGFWPKSWRQGQTLETALQRSVVWYFQDIARDVGGSRYREILKRWSYGNAEAPDGDDGFWLYGPLAISVEEQVAFVSALLLGEIARSQDTLAALFAATRDSEDKGRIIYGKTGSGPLEQGRSGAGFEGWYVGWVTRQDRAPVAFAHYVRARTYADLRVFRRDQSLILLEACGF